jgi:hypothetical protein
MSHSHTELCIVLSMVTGMDREACENRTLSRSIAAFTLQ